MTGKNKNPKNTTRRKSGRVRIEDVARLAGVGAMTVSRAINNPQAVSDAKRKAIEAAILETGYVPNLMAGSLASNRSKIIAVLAPLIKTSTFSDILQGMSDTLEDEGYQLLIGSTSYSIEREERLVRAFLSRRADGIVLTGFAHTQNTRKMLEGADVAVVETLELTDAPIDMAVGCSTFRAAADMARHMADKGYRKIGLITPPKAFDARVDPRLKGFVEGLKEAGLPGIEGRQVEAGELSIDAGGRALEQLLAQHPETQAVFCSADMFAIGATLACSRNDWAVPQRVAIAGFGDTDIASQLHPSLTTIRLKGYEIGSTIANLFLRKLSGEDIAQSVWDVGYELIQRESV
ncbi:LacI family DNA-binding transcriptional regulator [Eilatimonas milleporae]|uniref:LacI family transcriptional regulator n=1 Tax=Eilatimonas milleporae TaxID=911205 RepID=A0A3M0C558_9PROT|nr:LacI family DNA-binding transcriptional regulator [Eilatimonas milleporae]RMB04954.1 LacI family transcriptional regulator [Eilatimonas milleporae]